MIFVCAFCSLSHTRLFLLLSNCLNSLRWHSKEKSFKTTEFEVLLDLSSHCYTREDSKQKSGTESMKHLQHFPAFGDLRHIWSHMCFFFYRIRQSLPIFLTYPNKNYCRPTGHLYSRIWACLKRWLHAEPIHSRLYARRTSNESSPHQVQHMAYLQHKIAGPVLWSIAFQSFHQPCYLCAFPWLHGTWEKNWRFLVRREQSSDT